MNASAVLGDYHRLLPPGKNYELTAKFPGYVSRQTTVVLSQWKATTLDFVLEPLQSKDALQEIDCADQELAYHCAQPRLVSRVQSSLLDKGIRPWLSRKLVTSSDHPDMVSAVHMELFLVVSAGTVVVLVAGVLFLLARRRRALKGQPVRDGRCEIQQNQSLSSKMQFR